MTDRRPVATVRDRGALRIRVDRPPVNVHTIEVMDLLADALDSIDDDVRVVVLEAAGPHFSAGVDIESHLPPTGGAMLDAVARLFETLDRVAAPTLAVVRGACLGGGFELALACDLLLVADDARLGLPEIGLACFPPVAAVLLPDRVAGGLARDMLLTGRPIDGARAAAVGLASRSVAPDDLDRAADALVDELTALGPRSLRAAKRAIGCERLAGAIAIYRREILESPETIAALRAWLDARTR